VEPLFHLFSFGLGWGWFSGNEGTYIVLGTRNIIVKYNNNKKGDTPHMRKPFELRVIVWRNMHSLHLTHTTKKFASIYIKADMVRTRYVGHDHTVFRTEDITHVHDCLKTHVGYMTV
jgi:hypothetical protein